MDQHVLVGLHDLLQVVVEHGQHRRPADRAEPEQAALGERPDLGIVVGARRVEAVLEPPGGAGVGPEEARAFGRPRLRRGGQRRTAPVRRVGDDGRPPFAVDPEHAGAPIDPEGVVAADVAGRATRTVAADRRRHLPGLHRAALGDAGLAPLVRSAGCDAEQRPERAGVGRDERRLLRGQGSARAETPRPLQGRQRRGIVGARQVRPAGRRTRSAVLRGGRHRQRQRQHDGRGNESTGHRLLPLSKWARRTRAAHPHVYGYRIGGPESVVCSAGS